MGYYIIEHEFEGYYSQLVDMNLEDTNDEPEKLYRTSYIVEGGMGFSVYETAEARAKENRQPVAEPTKSTASSPWPQGQISPRGKATVTTTTESEFRIVQEPKPPVPAWVALQAKNNKTQQRRNRKNGK